MFIPSQQKHFKIIYMLSKFIYNAQWTNTNSQIRKLMTVCVIEYNLDNKCSKDFYFYYTLFPAV